MILGQRDLVALKVGMLAQLMHGQSKLVLTRFAVCRCHIHQQTCSYQMIQSIVHNNPEEPIEILLQCRYLYTLLLHLPERGRISLRSIHLVAMSKALGWNRL